MKKYFFLILLFLGWNQTSQAQWLTGWEIDSFHVDLEIQKDSSLIVTETIVADFTNEAHHGLIRSVPVEYRDQYGNKLKLKAGVLSVTDERGQVWWYETSREGDYLNIQAGDEDQTFNKPVTFIFKYSIERAVTDQSFGNELYWNVTGTESTVPTLETSATVHLPAEVDSQKLQALCFTGGWDSKEADCSIEKKGDHLEFKAQNALAPYENLTVVVGMPSGVVTSPDQTTKTLWFLQDNWPYLIPMGVFLFLFLLWLMKGRNPQVKKDLVIAQYKAPEDLGPTEVGTILDERVDFQDLTATLIDMAVKGFIKIEERVTEKLFRDKREYTLIKLKEWEKSDLKDYEKKMLNSIFGEAKKIALEDLNYSFYNHLEEIKGLIYEQLMNIKVFPNRPDRVKTTYWVVGFFVILIGIILSVSVFEMQNIPFFISSIVSGLIIMSFAPFMPRKTKKGMELHYQILGLEEFIRVAEKDRLKFQENENVFEKLLPYAMVFGLAEKWSKAFEGIYKGKPQWFESNDPHFNKHFNSYLMWTSLNSLSKAATTSMISAPRSSSGTTAWSGGSGFSGGFSGGGFGGGGTKAW